MLKNCLPESRRTPDATGGRNTLNETGDFYLIIVNISRKIGGFNLIVIPKS